MTGLYPQNDNERHEGLTDASRRWLVKEFGLLEWTTPALAATLEAIVPKAAEGDPYFAPEDWLQCLLHFETVLMPITDDMELLKLQEASYWATTVMIGEAGLERATDFSVTQFRQHEKLVSAMIEEGAYAPQLAVECGMLDGLRNGFAGELPTIKEVISSTRKLAAYCHEGQHEALPQVRWLAMDEIVDIGCAKMSLQMPVRPPAGVIDLQAAKLTRKPT